MLVIGVECRQHLAQSCIGLMLKNRNDSFSSHVFLASSSLAWLPLWDMMPIASTGWALAGYMTRNPTLRQVGSIVPARL
jgi:hypothetical protein